MPVSVALVSKAITLGRTLLRSHELIADKCAPGTRRALSMWTTLSWSAFGLQVRGLIELWKSLDYVTPDGQTGRIERGINGGGHSGLVTCTYIGAVSGNHYTVTGFFTP
jgi:hypothetical protein